MVVHVDRSDQTRTRSAGLGQLIVAVVVGSALAVVGVTIAGVVAGAVYIPAFVSAIAETAPAVTSGPLLTNLLETALVGLAVGLLLGLFTHWFRRRGIERQIVEAVGSREAIAALSHGAAAFAGWAVLGLLTGAIVGLLGAPGLLRMLDANGMQSITGATVSMLGSAGLMGGGDGPPDASSFGALAALAMVIVLGSALVGAVLALGWAAIGAAVAAGALGGLGRTLGHAGVAVFAGRAASERGWFTAALRGGALMGAFAGIVNAGLVLGCVEVHSADLNRAIADRYQFELIETLDADAPGRNAHEAALVLAQPAGIDKITARMTRPYHPSIHDPPSTLPGTLHAVGPNGRYAAMALRDWETETGEAPMLVVHDLVTGESFEIVVADEFDTENAPGVCAVDPTGAFVAVPQSGGAVVYRLDDGGVVTREHGGSLPARWMGFSPDGRWLAVEMSEGNRDALVTWRTDDWVTSASRAEHSYAADKAWHPDGTHLASTLGSLDGFCWIDVDTGDVSGTIGLPGDTWDLAISPDGALIAAATSEGVRVLAASTNAEIARLGDPRFEYRQVAFTPDGIRLVGARAETGSDAGVGAMDVWRVVETSR